jgi:TPR repeat protein
VSNACTLAKQARRAQLEAELGARILALPTKQYGVGLADPPWRFEPYSRVTGMDRVADNHYATNPLEQIKTLNVSSIMAKDSVMFLWAVTPMLPQAPIACARREQGVAYAQDRLALMYRQGRGGLPQDYAEAAKWVRKSAEQGDAIAQAYLGTLYLQGVGVAHDYAEAANWLRKAANQGDAPAQWWLGGMYEAGWGVPQDYVVAHMWFNLLAAQGDFKSASKRDELAAKMTPDQLAEVQRLAREWKPTKRRHLHRV